MLRGPGPVERFGAEPCGLGSYARRSCRPGRWVSALQRPTRNVGVGQRAAPPSASPRSCEHWLPGRSLRPCRVRRSETTPVSRSQLVCGRTDVMVLLPLPAAPPKLAGGGLAFGPMRSTPRRRSASAREPRAFVQVGRAQRRSRGYRPWLLSRSKEVRFGQRRCSTNSVTARRRSGHCHRRAATITALFSYTALSSLDRLLSIVSCWHYKVRHGCAGLGRPGKTPRWLRHARYHMVSTAARARLHVILAFDGRLRAAIGSAFLHPRASPPGLPRQVRIDLASSAISSRGAGA